MTKNDQRRFVGIGLRPRTGKLLGGYALIAMHGWFVVKLTLPSQTGLVEPLVGFAALTGLVASACFFLGTYGSLARASETTLDERELASRNRAYFSAFRYIVLMTFVGGIIPDLLASFFNFELSVGILQNFILLMFATALVLPGFLIARSEREFTD
jgi:hypothetical protein